MIFTHCVFSSNTCSMLVYRFLTVGIFGIAQLVFYANGVVHLYSIMQHCSSQTLPMNQGETLKKSLKTSNLEVPSVFLDRPKFTLKRSVMRIKLTVGTQSFC